MMPQVKKKKLVSSTHQRERIRAVGDKVMTKGVCQLEFENDQKIIIKDCMRSQNVSPAVTYCIGRTLHDLLNEKRLSPTEVL